MRTIELTPKASQDLEAIWFYTYERYGEAKADSYLMRFSDIFNILKTHDIGTARTELGLDFNSLPVEQHVLFFISTDIDITIIRILSHSQDVNRHLSWQ